MPANFESMIQGKTRKSQIHEPNSIYEHIEKMSIIDSLPCEIYDLVKMIKFTDE